jgi:hypothetical protein
MKLITKTIHNPKGDGFLISFKYKDYQQLYDELRVDRSITFHDNHTIMYLIEIVADDHIDELTKAWDEVIEFENVEERGLTVSVRVENAFNKK